LAISPGRVNLTTKNLRIADDSDKTRKVIEHSLFSANDKIKFMLYLIITFVRVLLFGQ